MTTSQDTKSKIVNTARVLFARYGFNGTSVRDISAEAGVNVASINYHFSNKQALFWEVFRAGYEQIESALMAIESESLSPEETTVQVFRTLLANWKDASNTFRIVLSGSLPEADSNMRSFCEGKIGPPGVAVLKSAITRKHGELPEAGLTWASHTIFSATMHWSLIMGTAYIKEFGSNHEVCNKDHMEQSVTSCATAIINHLLANKEQFES